MPEPYNYAAQLGQIDIPGAFARGLQVRQLQNQVAAEPQQRALEAEKVRVAVEAKRAELAQQQAYQNDLGALLQSPSAEGYRAVMLRYPDQYEAVKAGWEAYNEDQKKALLDTSSGVYAALSNGQPDLAVELLKSRKAALQSQGVPTQETDAILSLVESGDEAKIKQAKGLAGYALAAAVGPEKIGAMLERLDGGEAKVLGYGDRLVSSDGQVLFTAPDAPFTLGEGAARYSGSGGGDLFTRVLRAEGGTGRNGEFLTSPKGAVGPAQVMPGTAPEAARLAGLPWDEKRYRSDPSYNKALGKAYLDEQLRTFGGNEAMAAAAYNAGPGAVKAALRKGGVDGWTQFLPAETRAYIGKVTGAAPIAARPKEKEGPKLSPKGIYQGVTSRADYDALPTGALYVARDGTTRRKK